MKPGDIVIFKRSGWVAAILSWLLKLFEAWWDRWGWHMAILWQAAYQGWYILEATGVGVKINYYSDGTLEGQARVYPWLEESPDRKQMWRFLEEHIDKDYDVAIYFWTGLQYLIRHFINHRIPRLLDDRFTCWELAFEFCEAMGKPIGSKYDCPMITDFLKTAEARK